MEEAVRGFIQDFQKISNLWLCGILAAGAFLEYIFPPFPGDVWTAGGAVLFTQRGTLWAVFFGYLAVNLGAAVGFVCDYAFGLWLSDPRRHFRHWGPRWERLGQGIDRIALGFRRHTVFYLVVNRFLPGIRALFFVAAGFAKVPLWKVLFFGMISAAAWNALIFTFGWLVGKNLDLLLLWLGRYTKVAWVVVITVIAVILVRFFIRRRAEAPPP